MATSTALAPGLSRKLKKVLETRTDSPDLLASLNTLSSFYTENAPHSRRNLRSTIEKRALSINEEYLLAYGAVQQSLDQVEDQVSELDKCCDSITERLKQDLENNRQKQEIVSCFLRDYQLSEEKINALRVEDLNETFFKALGHVQDIHSNCKVLLRTHHRVGKEVERTSPGDVSSEELCSYYGYLEHDQVP